MPYPINQTLPQHRSWSRTLQLSMNLLPFSALSTFCQSPAKHFLLSPAITMCYKCFNTHLFICATEFLSCRVVPYRSGAAEALGLTKYEFFSISPFLRMNITYWKLISKNNCHQYGACQLYLFFFKKIKKIEKNLSVSSAITHAISTFSSFF